MNNPIFRLLDLIFAAIGLLCLWPIALIVMIIGYFDNGSPIFFQSRVGKNQQPFTLIKFRTMPVTTQSVATHLAAQVQISKFGQFLRRTKLDELLQLINILKGEMSFVGPRPCLFNQEVLINARAQKGVFDVKPGITGLAQVNNIDMSRPEYLAQVDASMIESFQFSDYFQFIIRTVLGGGQGDNLPRQ